MKATEKAGYRRQEMEWLGSHRADLAIHRGKWVVLEGQEVLASEPDYQTARARATSAGIRRPLIFFIPGDDADAFMGV